MCRKGAKESNQIGTGSQVQMLYRETGITSDDVTWEQTNQRWFNSSLPDNEWFWRCNKDDFFELDTGGGYSLRGHHMKLKVHRSRSRLQLWQCFFSQRVVSLWNKLPASVVEDTSICSRSDWTIGSRMWAFEASLLVHCITRYKLDGVRQIVMV